MKPLVIYHANCADGFGAAFAAWLKLGDEAEYVACQYGDKNNLPKVIGRNVYILDFSFPRESMDVVFSDAKHVVWLDHHKTAFEMWLGAFTKGAQYNDATIPHYICLDDNKSGAMLTWEWFHPGTEVPMLIKHIDDYDRWQFKIDGTKAFNKALWSYSPWSFEQWKELNRQLEAYADHGGDFPHFIFKEGAAILRAHDQNVQSVVKGSTRKCGINWVPTEETGMYDPNFAAGHAANCPPHLTSDVGHALATQSGTFGLCWHLGREGTMAKCSLRSNGEYDVSAIAKAFGGGGHKNAAGFEVPIDTLLAWLK